MKINRWGTTSDKLRFAVVDRAPLTVSGYNEVVAAFRTKKDANSFRMTLGKTANSRLQYEVIPLRLDVTFNG